MGVKLSEIIIKKPIEFSDLKNKKIAIDFSNMAYQFLSSIRSPDGTPLMDSKGNVTSVYVGIFSRVSNLMSQGIKPCFVFDGKPPLLKTHTKEEREYRKRVAEEKLKQAKEEKDLKSIERYAKQTSRLTSDIVNGSKELLKSLGLPVIQAPSEADAQGAYLVEKGDVWGFASSDIDCLLHNCPKLITNLTLSQRRKLPSGAFLKTTPEMIELKDVLNNLNITQDQLIVIAILCGTDYNKGIHRVGPKTALKLVKQYQNFDDLFKEVKADFNWKKIYAIFKSMPIMKNYQLNYTDIDEDKIKEILIEKHEFSKERVEKTLQKLTKKDKSQSSLSKWS
ncbi:MAG: flap endonuclease-1 [Nanoarchaeota archaeon]|nr:flap endonuclease-1 [Nanoarchaeota archaeon]